MYIKDMEDFPAYLDGYIAQTTGIESVKKEGIIT